MAREPSETGNSKLLDAETFEICNSRLNSAQRAQRHEQNSDCPGMESDEGKPVRCIETQKSTYLRSANGPDLLVPKWVHPKPDSVCR